MSERLKKYIYIKILYGEIEQNKDKADDAVDNISEFSLLFSHVN